MLFLFTSSIVTANELITLCYHDVRDDITGHLDHDQGAVSSRELVNQFSWLREHGYIVVSMQQVIDAKQGGAALPPKAVLLTFDDGYVSFYTRIYPLLKLFNYPAVFALVTQWLEVPEGGKIPYGQGFKDRKDFLSWDQVREMADSGLVEMAAHSHGLHHGEMGNPQKNSQPAMVTRIYDPNSQAYETDDAYYQRIKSDLARNSDLIYQHTNKRPRVMVWPYGAFSQVTQKIAADLGMPITLILNDYIKNHQTNLAEIHRYLISGNPSIATFASFMRQSYDDNEIRRVAHIDLDYIYDANETQMVANLDRLLDRIKAMKINTVYLQAFADPDADGNADALYFPNRHLPMRADLFNRVAWQLKTRAGTAVYAWMPVTAFDLPNIPSEWRVKEWKDGKAQDAKHNYRRLSFFNPKVKTIIGEIYEDLGKHVNFDGILFHDDALLTDYEDAGNFAQIYAQMRKLPDFKVLFNDPEQRMRWAQLKTEAMIRFTDFLANKIRLYRPEIKTARNIYAEPVLRPKSEEWFAQSFEKFLQHYDYTAVMAMPYMEKAKDPQQWLSTLVDTVKTYPEAMKKTIFELQAVDWRTSQKIPDDVLEKQMRLLMRKGAVQFGYYPDDVMQNKPGLKMLKRTLSLETAPYGS
jgi:biofilm PGA synthesis lipoprotein PgaB